MLVLLLVQLLPLLAREHSAAVAAAAVVAESVTAAAWLHLVLLHLLSGGILCRKRRCMDPAWLQAAAQAVPIGVVV